MYNVHCAYFDTADSGKLVFLLLIMKKLVQS